MNKTFTQLENFGHSLKTSSYLIQPKTADEIYETFRLAKKMGITVTARGGGRSYNDAALNGGGIVMDMSGMNQISQWDPSTGLITCEPGVTLQQLWRKVLPDGWWPPVVSGTMLTTLGGCLSANIHGKNNYRMGTIGEHVLEFTAVLPTGAQINCSPKKNGDLFYAMISGLGMLGIFTSVTLQMKKMYSGLLEVHAWPTRTLKEHFSLIEDNAPKYDYIVGWLDTITTLGHGQIHAANYLHEGDDPNPQKTMQLANQDLPSRLFGVMPKSLIHYFMTPFVNNLGWGVVNTAKYVASLRKHTFRQPHAAFHFLLDYVPNWEFSVGRGGLIQYQSFLPKETALQAWTEMLTLAKKLGLPSFLGVTKRHRPDKFLLTHAVDGFSLALDFKVTDRNRSKLKKMLQEYDRIVLENGGRFYFAKDSTLRKRVMESYFPKDNLKKFYTLKKKYDPKGILQTDLYKRVFLQSV